MVLREAPLLLVDARGVRRSTGAPVLLTGNPAIARPAWRSTVLVRGRLGPTDRADDRVATLAVSGDPRRPLTTGRRRVSGGAAARRPAGRRSTARLPDARGLLPGLVIGDTSRTPPDLTAAMRATGMTHLTAVSGSNVAVVTGLVLGLCVVLGIPRRWRPRAGPARARRLRRARPSRAERRAGRRHGRDRADRPRAVHGGRPGLPVLGAAIVVVLVVDPWLARSFGFALSSLATLGLLLFTRPWGDAIGARLPRRLAPLGPALAIPVAAQAMTAPVVVLLQGSVSVVGVLANLLAAPLVPVATVAGVAASLTSVLSAPRRRAGRVGRRAARRRSSRRSPGGSPRCPVARCRGPTAPRVPCSSPASPSPCSSPAARWPPVPRPTRCSRSAPCSSSRPRWCPTRAVTWPPDGWRVVVVRRRPG